MFYALRVDLEHGPASDVADWLGTAGGAYLLVREGGDANPHVHAILESEREIRMLRQSLKRHISWLAGNGDYSLATVRDTEKYERYICKGEDDASPVIVARMGIAYTDEWVELRRSQYWQEQTDYKARHKRKGLHSATVVEKLEEICKAKGIKWDQDKKIGAEYLRLLSESKKGVNSYQLRAVVRGVQLQLCPDDSCIDWLLVDAGFGV